MKTLTEAEFNENLRAANSEYGVNLSALDNRALKEAFNTVNKGLSEIGTGKGKGR